MERFQVLTPVEASEILNKKAFSIYCALDPLDVIKNDRASYSLEGLIDLDTVSIRTLNRVLERVYNGCSVLT